jgi:hypothetical protein
MKKTAITVAIVSLFAFAALQIASSQEPASVAGTWDITMKIAGEKVSEQWTITPSGDDCSATIKGSSGELKVPCEVNGATFRSDFKDLSGKGIKVRAGISGDRMDGSYTIGDKQEYFWTARRSKS